MKNKTVKKSDAKKKVRTLKEKQSVAPRSLLSKKNKNTKKKTPLKEMLRNNAGRKKLAVTRHENEATYRSLFENMLNGFAHCRMIYADGKPVDFLYLKVNSAFEKLTGLKAVEGRRVSEAIPGIRQADPELFDIYGRVAFTGRPEVFERYVKALQMWFYVSVYSPARGQFVAIFDVITERKRAEEALRESERRRREAQRIARIGNWEWNLRTGEVHWSSEIYTMSGMTPDAVALTPDALIKLVHPDDVETVRTAISRAISEGAPADFDYRIVLADGSVRVIHALGAVTEFDDAGRPSMMLGTNQDITERKKAEEALAKNKELLELMGRITHTGAWELDVSTGRQIWTDETYAIHDRKQGEYDPNAAEEIGRFESASRELIAGAFKEAVRNGVPYDLDLEMTTVKGNRKWVRAICRPVVESGKVIKLSGTVQDITERRRMEETLRESQRFSLATLNAMSAHICVLDEAGRIVTVNSAWRSFADANPPVLTNVGEGANYLMVCDAATAPDAEDAAAFAAGIRAVMRGDQVDFSMEYSCHSPDTQRWFLGRATRFTGAGPVFIVIAHENITERKRAELALQADADQLAAVLNAQHSIASADLVYSALIQFILECMSRLSEAEGASLEMADGDEMVYEAATGVAEPFVGLRLKIAGSLSGRCLTSGEMIRSDDCETDLKADRAACRRIGLRSMVLLPLRYDEHSFGVLKVMSSRIAAFSAEVERTLRLMGGFLGATIARKQAGEALRRAEEKYRGIFENAQEGIYQSTPEGRFILANRAMARMLGYDSPEGLITGIVDIGRQVYVNPDIRTEIVNRAKKQDLFIEDEVQFYRKDGRMIWVSRTLRAVRDEKGRFQYFEGIAQDITERKENFERLRNALGGTVQAIALMVETLDPYTAGHQRRVSDLARAIATEMSLPDDRVEGLRVAAIIHDIGKLSVPAEILSKPTKLTNLEFGLIKTHPQAGYDILKDIDFPWRIARMVIEHHERMNGSGYPNGLTGEKLLLESRILAVADVVEAMASHRPYRASLGVEPALEEIEKKRRILYDDAVVEACLKLFREKGYQITSAL